MDTQFECPSALPTELIGNFPLATTSRSTLYEHCYILLYIRLHPNQERDRAFQQSLPQNLPMDPPHRIMTKMLVKNV